MFCGLDFGTSNSTLGTLHQNKLQLLCLEKAGQSTLPSTAFYYEDSYDIAFGQAALNCYLEGLDGRLMRSIKSVLGTSLADEQTRVGSRRIPFKTVIGNFLAEMKKRAEETTGTELTAVVQGRPVNFVDQNPEGNRKAQDLLEEILKSIGFKHISFQMEPIAAAWQYESTAEKEGLALVVDIGGGTSDFSVIRIRPDRQENDTGEQDVLSDTGIRLGGIDFDQCLSLAGVMPLLGYGASLRGGKLNNPNWLYRTLSIWPQINQIYTQRSRRDIDWILENGDGDIRFDRLSTVAEDQLGHHIANDVEQTKIRLSSEQTVDLDLSYLEQGLNQRLDQDLLAQATEKSRSRLKGAIDESLKQAECQADDIQVVLMTGGSTEMPVVRQSVRDCLPGATFHNIDKFGAVGYGLALEAQKRFR